MGCDMLRSDKLAITSSAIASGGIVVASVGLLAVDTALTVTGIALIANAGALYIASLFVEDER